MWSRVTKGRNHTCTRGPEIRFILSGTGTITLGQKDHPLRPGSVTVIPAGVLHSLEASAGEEVEFVIFGTPPMAVDDERARQRKGINSNAASQSQKAGLGCNYCCDRLG